MIKHKESGKQSLILTKRLWIFLVLGAVIFILGIIVGGIYFNIQSITSSSQHTEIIPTYILCLFVIATGLSIISLVCRRYIYQVYAIIILSVVTGTFSAIVSILTGTHILQQVTSLESCDFKLSTSSCTCSSSYKRQHLALDYLGTEKVKVIFERTASCEAILDVLPALLYSEIGLLLAILCLCVLSVILAYLVVKSEKSRLQLLQEETYDDIFTVSGNSSIADSDDDIITSNIPAVNDIRSVIGKHTEPISILKVPDLQNSLDSSKSSRSRSTEGEKSIEKTFLQLQHKISALAFRRSRSCDSLDDFDKLNNLDTASSQSSRSNKGNGKLKEHRRREKRATTLHNLDTKQLMLILDLHKKYEEETNLLKSQGNLNTEGKPKFDNRRALTPQPYVNKSNPIPKIIRSHTPQPKTPQRSDSLRRKEEQEIKNFKKEIKELFLKQSELLNSNIDKVKVNSNKPQSRISKPSNNQSKSLPSHRKLIDVNSNSLVANTVNQKDMNRQQRPRPSVQNHFLPSEPLHRKSADKMKLPPQPLTRQSSHGDTLPPQPLQRDGSAFYIVGSQLDLSENSKSLKTPGEIRYEKAIKENFKLCKKSEENPYATSTKQKSRQSAKNAKGEHNGKGQRLSEMPPPYPNPPSYSDFVSISQDDSSVRSDSQSTYDTIDQGKSESSDIKNESRDRLLTGSSDDEVFVPESQKSIYSCVAKKQAMPKMGVSANLRSPPGAMPHQPSVFHTNHDSSHHNHNHPYHTSELTNPSCVQVENHYHDPSRIYHSPCSPNESPYHHPHKLTNPNGPVHNSPYANSKNFHYYEEIDNIETSFMYCEDMLPSTSSNSSQTALLPSNTSTNGKPDLKPYRPITTMDPSGETLETMI